FPLWMILMIVFRVRWFNRAEIVATISALAVSGVAGFLIIKGLQPSAGASSITWRPGWLATNTNWFYFWAKNIGLYIILGPFAFLYFFYRQRSLALLTLAGMVPFIAANLFQFAPWDWDNTKIFAPAWIIASVAVASLISSWWQNGDL